MRRLAPTLMRRPRTQWTSMSHLGRVALVALSVGDSVITPPRSRRHFTAGPSRKPVGIGHWNFRWR